LHILVFIFPVGVLICFKDLRDEHVFVIIYSILASYFAGVMVRLMLTLTPVVCVAAAIAISTLLDTYVDPREPGNAPEAVPPTPATAGLTPTFPTASLTPQRPSTPTTPTTPSMKKEKKAKKSGNKNTEPGIYGTDTRIAVVLNVLFLLLIFVLHCTWATSNAYSSPSVVLASRGPDGSPAVIDDFREAYYWLRQNTPQDAVVMSWWDYGYQIAGMADRPTLVDNNTWNNSTSSPINGLPLVIFITVPLPLTAHIATVGKALSSSEEKAYPIMLKHDVSYVLVLVGSLIQYSGDDLNKFLWMIRIASGVWPDEIQEANFYNSRGEFRVDETASTAMKESIMYKMSYYRSVTLPLGVVEV
jgi:dolichyl-diphosphooligosaccharide---protein glycosyltransferase